jgi:CheY-like chemotaxis protein
MDAIINHFKYQNPYRLLRLRLDQKSRVSKGNSGLDSHADDLRKHRFAEQDSPSLKILVVDDEQDIVFTVKTFLTEAGFSVDSFTDPLSAFEMFRPRIYEIIILDIRMPELNGFELYLKLLEKDSSIKVIFLTAVSEFSTYANFKDEVSPASGKRHYLQKPVDFAELLQRVDDMLAY